MLETDNTKRFFFVDYENVNISGLDGLLSLNSIDEVFIFYSENADCITFDVHKNLNETKAKVNFQKVEVGSKNALDFQLSSYLGFVISENLNKGNENVSYFLVTNDLGFSCLITFWNNKNVNISMVNNLLCYIEGEDKNEDKNVEPITGLSIDTNNPYLQLMNDIQSMNNALDNENLKFIVEVISNNNKKTEINNALSKKYKDSKKSSEIYKIIKPLLNGKE